MQYPPDALFWGIALAALVLIALVLFFGRVVWSLYFFAFCIPLDLLPEALGWGDAITPAHFAGVIMLASWVASKLTHPKLRVGVMNFVVLAIPSFGAASLLWSPQSALGLRYLLTLTQLCAMYWILVDLASIREVCRRVLTAAAAGAFVIIVVAVYSVFVMGRYRTIFYAAGEEGFVPNRVAPAVALGMGVALGQLLHARRLLKLPSLVFLVLGVTAIVLTGSRGGMSAIFFGLFAGTAFSSWATRDVRKSVWSAVICGVLVIISLSWVRVLDISATSGWERWVREDTGSLGSRPLAWSVYLDAWRAHPFFGAGLGTANDYSSLSELVTDRRSFLQLSRLSSAGHMAPHNIFTSALVNGGLFYCLLWAVFIFTPFFRLISQHPLSTLRSREVAVALFTASCILLVSMMIENIEYTKFLWFGTALLHAFGWRAQASLVTLRTEGRAVYADTASRA